MFYMMSLEIDIIKRYSREIFLVSIILLILVLMPGIGKEVAGARRWLKLGHYSIQPSEFAKFALFLYLANFVARKGHVLKDIFYGYVPPLLAIGAASVLILMEPDFGTAIAIFIVGMLVLFVAGARFKHLIFTML